MSVSPIARPLGYEPGLPFLGTGIERYPVRGGGATLMGLEPGDRLEIIDPEGREVPDGEPGRLRVRGGSTALCYWADRAKSLETFQGDWCTSADVFRRDDGNIGWIDPKNLAAS